jgi:hypothetical protein
MEAFIAIAILIVVVAVMAGVDALALMYGADSRPEIQDDHRR